MGVDNTGGSVGVGPGAGMLVSGGVTSEGVLDDSATGAGSASVGPSGTAVGTVYSQVGSV